MGFIELFLIGAGLAMDAFAVSICKGLNMKKINYRHAFIIAFFFGAFQMIMPLIGYALGSGFQTYIESIDHWIVFALLAVIGGQMILEAIRGGGSSGECDDDVLYIKQLFMLAIATSIDALAVGITFALLKGTNIWISISIIGIVTFIISFAGVVMGNKFGNKYERKAQFAGGLILVFIGVKVLLEHLGVFENYL